MTRPTRVQAPEPYGQDYAPPPSAQRSCCDSLTDEVHTDRCRFPHAVRGIDVPNAPGGYTDAE